MQRYSFRNKWHSETEKDINILLLIVHENEAVWAIITADGYISGLKMVFFIEKIVTLSELCADVFWYM